MNDIIRIGLFYYEGIDESITKGFENALDKALDGKGYEYKYEKFVCYDKQDKNNLPDIFVIDTATLTEYINDFQILDKNHFKDINIDEFYPFSIPKDSSENLYGLPQIMCTNIFFSWKKDENPEKDKFIFPGLGSYEYVREYEENLKKSEGNETKAIELTKNFFNRVDNNSFESFIKKESKNAICYTELTNPIKEDLVMYKTTDNFFIDLALINKKVKDEKLTKCIDILKHISSKSTFLEASGYGESALLPPRKSCISLMKEHQHLYQTMDKIISDNTTIHYADFGMTLSEIEEKANWIKNQIKN
jgi:hypothetical protein